MKEPNMELIELVVPLQSTFVNIKTDSEKRWAVI